jgi:hypothetical protein
MNTSRKLKIWTMITPGLIVVGWGHGILFFFLIEIFGFPYFSNENISFRLTLPFESRMPLVGFWILLGQVFILVSIFVKRPNLKLATHVIGILVLWIGVLYFTYNLTHERYVHFATFTVIPFAICTMLTFTGSYLRTFYNWVIDKEEA